VLGGDVGEGAVTRGEAATSTGRAGTRWPREGFGGRRAHQGAVGAACSAPSVNSCFLILSGGSHLGVCNPVVTAHKNFTVLVLHYLDHYCPKATAHPVGSFLTVALQTSPSLLNQLGSPTRQIFGRKIFLLKTQENALHTPTIPRDPVISRQIQVRSYKGFILTCNTLVTPIILNYIYTWDI